MKTISEKSEGCDVCSLNASGVALSALDLATRTLTDSCPVTVQALFALAETLQDDLANTSVAPGSSIENEIISPARHRDHGQLTESGRMRQPLVTLSLLLRHTERNLLLLHGSSQSAWSQRPTSLAGNSHTSHVHFASVTSYGGSKGWQL